MLTFLMLLSLFAVNYVIDCDSLKIIICANLLGIVLYAFYDIILYNISTSYYEFTKTGILQKYHDYMKENETVYGFEDAHKAILGITFGIFHAVNLSPIFKVALFSSFLIVAFNSYHILISITLLRVSLIVIVIMLSCLVISNYLSAKLQTEV